MFMLSLELLGVSKTVPIVSAYPMFTTFFTVLFFNEPFTSLLLMGTVLIIVGIWLVSPERVCSSDLTRRVISKGVFIYLSTALVWSLSIIFMNYALEFSQMAAFDSAFVVNTARMADPPCCSWRFLRLLIADFIS